MTEELAEVLTSKEAAAYLHLTEGHVRNMRCEGTGPRWHRVRGHRVAYYRADLDFWRRWA